MNDIGIIAKTEEDAFTILHNLQNERIIGAFDEEYFEVSNKEVTLQLIPHIGLCIGAVYANGSFDDDEEIVSRVVKLLDKYMTDDDQFFIFSYEVIG